MNAKAETGSFSAGSLLRTFELSSGSIQFTAPISNGDGNKSVAASKSNCTQAFFKALPTKTGYISLLITHFLIAFKISSFETSSPDKNFSANSSSNNVQASTISSLIILACSKASDGISCSTCFSPFSHSKV